MLSFTQLLQRFAALAQEMEAATPVAQPSAPSHVWLKQPFYLAPSQNFVETASSSGVPATTLTIESYLQSVLQSTMSYIQGYLNPAYNTFMSSRTAQAIIDYYVQTAEGRAAFYPSTAVGIDPVARGTFYGNLQVSLMQQIDSGQFAGGTPGVSLFDAWVGMKSTA